VNAGFVAVDQVKRAWPQKGVKLHQSLKSTENVTLKTKNHHKS
jgi:hypothetical protein